LKLLPPDREKRGEKGKGGERRGLEGIKRKRGEEEFRAFPQFQI